MIYNRKLIKDFAKSQRDHPNWPVLISEGDSWFSHSRVIDRLDDPLNRNPQTQRDWCLLRLEKNGDEILTILSGGQRAELRNFFKRWPLDAVLFSAGGNDVIGADLLPLLRLNPGGERAEDFIHFPRFERRLRQIQDCYRELLDLLVDAGQSAKVFVNCYDYPVPSDRPVRLLGIRLAGPWLLPNLIEREVPKRFYGGVIKLLIDGFVAKMEALANEDAGRGRLVLVDTRGKVGQNWQDEIHPNFDGSTAVAKAFEAALVRERIIR